MIPTVVLICISACIAKIKGYITNVGMSCEKFQFRSNPRYLKTDCHANARNDRGIICIFYTPTFVIQPIKNAEEMKNSNFRIFLI